MAHLTPVIIRARDLSEAWFMALREILQKDEDGELLRRSYSIDRGSYEGEMRLEFDYVLVHILYPGARPLIPEIPPGMGIPAPTSMDYVENYFSRYLMTDVLEPEEEYTYGERLSGNPNQIEAVIKMYRESGGFGTNQATMEVGMPSDIGQTDPPCLRIVDTRISGGRLHFMIYFRSWDLWGGFPANLAGLQLMKEYMASEIGVEDGEIIAASKGLHLYDHVWEIAQKRAYLDEMIGK